jgi:hypothetical protein
MPGSRLQNRVKQMLYKPNKNKIFKALNLDAVRELGEAMDKGIDRKGEGERKDEPREGE